MFLKAYELGLGTCFMGWIYIMNSNQPETLKKLAGIPEGYNVNVPLILGYPKTEPAPGKREKPNIMKWT
jgi:nitroreductase